jgi:hypothetical protein
MDNIKMDQNVRIYTEFKWLKSESSGGLKRAS